MSKAARIKAARRQTPAPIGKHQQLSPRSIWGGDSRCGRGDRDRRHRPARDTTGPASPARGDAIGRRPERARCTRPGRRQRRLPPQRRAGVGSIENKPASGAQPSSNPGLLPVGTKAPTFSLKTPEGGAVGLDDLRGKAVLLEFFATWCPHCAAEAPHLQRLYGSLPKKDVAFVSVNADGEDGASVYAYHRYFGLTFPALLDPGNQPGSFTSPGGTGPTTQAYGVESFPTFYVLDRKGRITWRFDGEQPDALLRGQLERAAAATGA
jgi:peroxiredoxin